MLADLWAGALVNVAEAKTEDRAVAKQTGRFAVEIGQDVLERAGDFSGVRSVQANLQTVGCRGRDLTG